MILQRGMATVYTQADLTAVTAAIVDLATGKRVVTVTYAGPPQRSVQYAAVDLPQLRALQAEIQRDLNATPTYRRVSFGKGFDSGGGSSA